MEPCYKQIDKYYFDSEKPIGKGTYGTVYKAIDKTTGLPYAVKVIPCSRLFGHKRQYGLFLREINILRQLEGDHIVQLLDVRRTTNNIYIFMEFCNGGDLKKRIDAGESFMEDEACLIIKQIAHAFLTSENLQKNTGDSCKYLLMHRDIKPANILFHDGRVKIADFGFAKLVSEECQLAKISQVRLGTPYYMAPQLLRGESYSTKCDIWSAGVLLYKLLFRRHPWTTTTVSSLYHEIAKKPLMFPRQISEETQDLLKSMLQSQEENRITWKQVYDHSALKRFTIEPTSSCIISKTNERSNLETQASNDKIDSPNSNQSLAIDA